MISRALVALAAGFLAGCASIADGTIENSNFITFSSSPTGARITADERLICVTPCRERVPAELVPKLVATVPGKKPITIQEQASANLNVAGNVIFGGLIGLAVDAASGRATRYPSTIHVIFGD